MAATQMNMRIDSALKSSGDLAIREGGSTPSEVVRMTWEFLARNRHQPETIQKLFELLRGDSESNSSGGEQGGGEIADQVMCGARVIDEYCLERGLDPNTLPSTSYDQLKSDAADEMLTRMGAL